jgi:hypothetical protein
MSPLELWYALTSWGPFLLLVVAAFGFMLYMLAASLRQPGGSPLCDRYPPVEPAEGTKRTLERVVFGTGPRMTWVKVGADHAHLHVAFAYTLGNARFSVPLEEITAVPDRFPLMILAPDVIRLTFERDPGRPMLVGRLLFDRLSAASGGRLKVAGGGRAAPPPFPAGRQGGR